MFINGIQTGSTYSDSQNYVNGANRPALGIDANALNTSYFNGFMSNVKVIKGKALYTTNFSIPTAPATSTDAPTLLLNATNAGITDQTGRNNFLTYGTASVSSTQSKFGGASMYFDGSTGYLTTSNTYTQFGTTDFTVECWTYLTSKVTTYPCIFSNYNAYTAGSIALFAGHNSGTTTAYQVSYNGSTFPTSINGGTVNYNTWVHLAVVRSGTVITLYVNGSSVGTITGATAALNGVGSNFYIGTSGDTISTAYIAGYIDDFRVSKIARYTANFTPPTSAFPDL
jgi:hypothetical protein